MSDAAFWQDITTSEKREIAVIEKIVMLFIPVRF
jgi:hypothetical protein